MKDVVLACYNKLLAISTIGKTPYLWLPLYAPEPAFWNKTFKSPDMELVNQTRRVWYRERYYASGYACSTFSGGLIIKDIENRLPDLCIAELSRSPCAPRRRSDHFSIISAPKDPCCF
jgi:hypothetical protein